MLNVLKENLWKQFGASIDMLKNAIVMWPDEYWSTRKKVFYMAYHTLIFTDYYLTLPAKKVSPPLPFTMTPPGVVTHDAIDDLVPDRIFSKQEILDYLHACREKCHRVIMDLTEEKLKERWINPEGNRNYAFLELLLYNMRHVQHHAAQLNMILRQEINKAPGWVRRADGTK